MNDLICAKIESALWVALVREGKLLESSNLFAAYIENIRRLKVDKSLREQKEEELLSAHKKYIDELLKKASEYYKSEDWSNTIICYEIAYGFNKQVFEKIDILRAFITCLAKTEQKGLANDMIDLLKGLSQNDINEYKFIAGICDTMQDYQSAINYIDNYINSKNPDEISAEEYNILGIYKNQLYFNNMEEKKYLYDAIELFKKAHHKNPYNKTYLHNITIIAQYINEYQLINDCWEKIWEIGGLTHIEKFDYALQSIKQGKLEEGYKYYHEEFYLEDAKRRILFNHLKKPVWQGENIKNKTLLVHHHQGFGDTILMSKFIDMLKEHTDKIIFVVQNELYPLIKTSYKDINILSDNMVDLDNLHFDYYIPTMELPCALKINRKKIEDTNKKYLYVNQEKINYYKQNYFNNNTFKIGLSVRGNQEYDKFLKRTIPLTDCIAFNQLKNVSLYILTKDVHDTDLNIFNDIPVINIAKTFDSFEDTAAAIENCDIVVSIDNSTMNLAGALGKKTFGIFNYYNEWRWFDLSGDNIVWYSSVKPYVNEKMNDWKPTIEKVVEELQNYITTVL